MRFFIGLRSIGYKNFLLMACVGLLTVLVACSGGNSGQQQFDRVPLSALKLVKPENCQQLKDYIRKVLVTQYTDENQYAYCAVAGGGVIDFSNTQGAPQGPVAETSSSSPTGVSQTNTQEQGVGEADIIKADKDGNLFMIKGNHLILANAFPPQNMQAVQTIDLKDHAIGIYLHEAQAPNENRLVVITQSYGYYILPAVDALSIVPPIPNVEELNAHFFQLSYDSNGNVLSATQTGKLKIEGNYQDSRQIDNRLHIVSRYYLRPRLLIDADATLNRLRQEFAMAVNQQQCNKVDNSAKIQQLKLQITQRIDGLIDSLDVNDLLPKAYQDGNLVSGFLSCSDVHVPETKFSYGLQIITSIDSNGNNIGATASVNNAWITYASRDNIYMAQPSYGWWWSPQQASQTAIYKFQLGQGKPEYKAAGTIDGRALSQFSFSEYEGVLRTASTEDAMRWVFNDPNQMTTVSKNHLTILSDTGNGELQTIGSVKGFAPGETIQSVRFMADKGFVVTFRFIDPLFTFDLSNPRNPLKVGELKIPGFSSYMHPFGNDYLITIGREGNSSNTGTGANFQLQLVDISDLSNPRVHKTYTPPDLSSYSWSAAEYDHHAFTFYAPRNLLAIPASIYAPNSRAFNGILVFRVDPNAGSADQGGFVELGRIDHKDLAYRSYCDGTLYTPCIDYGYIYWANPRRTVVMTGMENQQVQEYLFTMSEVGLKATNVLDINRTLGSILFPSYSQPPIIVY